jgi:hypothetical protein
MALRTGKEALPTKHPSLFACNRIIQSVQKFESASGTKVKKKNNRQNSEKFNLTCSLDNNLKKLVFTRKENVK